MYKRILIPLDGSRLAEGILPFVFQIAGGLNLDVLLVRVEQPIAPHAMEGAAHFTADHIAARLKTAREYLAPVAADLRRQGLQVTTDARYGEPVTEIVAAARDGRADIIAMTTHGRSGLTRLVFGSVAEAVLRRAALPVLMMRLDKGEVSAAAAA